MFSRDVEGLDTFKILQIDLKTRTMQLWKFFYYFGLRISDAYFDKNGLLVICVYSHQNREFAVYRFATE